MAEKLTVREAMAERRGKNYTIEDFATEEEIKFIEEANSKPQVKRFDVASAISAEVLARFGFDAWKAWQNGDISVSDMNAYLSAERGRERELLVELELIVQGMLSAQIKRERNRSIPAGVKNAREVIKRQQAIIEGKR